MVKCGRLQPCLSRFDSGIRHMEINYCDYYNELCIKGTTKKEKQIIKKLYDDIINHMAKLEITVGE